MQNAMHQQRQLTLSAGLSILTDLICSLLPIAIMWNIQMPLQRKLLICSLMALGLLCTICSAVRAKSLNPKTKDIAYEYAIVAIWALTELNLGIIATNLALSRSLFYYFTKRDQDQRDTSHPRSHGSRLRSRTLPAPSTPPYTADSARRSSSRSRSEDSEVPLKPVTHKRTVVKVRR